MEGNRRRKGWFRFFLWLFVLLWMAVIFAFSAQAADDSNQTSSRVVRWLLTHFNGSFLSLSPEEQLQIMEAWSFVVRKLAHCVVFAVMGCLAFAAFSVDLPLRKAFPAALILGGVRGVLDEVHQSFVPGRSCEFRDMCIDFDGVLLGAALLLLILYRIQRKKLKK